MRRFLIIMTLASVLAGCTAEREAVPEPYRPTDARDAYRAGLQAAKLAGTGLAVEWQRAGDAALQSPVEISLPYREHGVFDARQAHAFGYRFAIARGQRVEITLSMSAPDPAVFVDVFRAADAAGESPQHVASAEVESRRLAFEPRVDAGYILRVQPELLRGGPYDLEVRVVAALDFPVADHSVSDIQSVFGAPRDAGRRQHHGVDIFAPRGTAAVATSRALVRRVQVRDLGGKVVWLHDQQRGLHLYYAHLDEQLVEQGTWVNPGDVVGRVGNTGNARTTPPHLHFGVYAQNEGPIDPDSFLRQPRQRLATLEADPAVIGAFAEASRPEVALRLAPSRRAGIVAALREGTPLRVWAAAGDRYRVTLDNGLSGFVGAGEVRLRSMAAAADD